MTELSEMETSNENNKSFNLLSFLKRSQEWLEISGYHVGDIQSEEKPVLITAGTTVVGDVFAQQVTVAGLLCGSVVANQVTIEKTGQIWGDLFTQKLQLDSGGKIQGWVSTVDAETLAEMQQGRDISAEISTPDTLQLPENQNGTPLPNNHNEIELTAYHQLQTEISAAKAARAELEQSFDTRLSEVAGDSSSKIESLSNEVENTKSLLNDVQTALKENEETLQQRNAQIERQQNEIELSQNLIQEQNEDLKQLEQTKNEVNEALQHLQEEKKQLDATLLEKMQQLDQQADRIHSIETAMQSSLQYSSDLEESLVRWQELAEVNEKRVEELEQEIANKQFQIDENNKLLDILKQQKQQVEEEWQLLHDELESTRSNPTRPLDDPNATKIDEEVLTAASAQILQLETELENLSQERAEQILWYRASLETSMSELELARQQMAEQETEIASLQEKVTEQGTMAASLQEKVAEYEATVGSLQEKAADLAEHETTVADLQEKVAELEAEIEGHETAVSDLKATFKEKRQEWLDWQQNARDEVTSLREDLRQKENQLAAGEDDLNFHLQEIEKQGTRLAEAHALLAERELQLKKARAMVQKQNQAIKDFRAKTETYIKRLQSKL